MIYVYECADHGQFEQKEPMLQGHRAYCADCGVAARRIFTISGWFFKHELWNPDGSRNRDYLSISG